MGQGWPLFAGPVILRSLSDEGRRQGQASGFCNRSCLCLGRKLRRELCLPRQSVAATGRQLRRSCRNGVSRPFTGPVEALRADALDNVCDQAYDEDSEIDKVYDEAHDKGADAGDRGTYFLEYSTRNPNALYLSLRSGRSI